MFALSGATSIVCPGTSTQTSLCGTSSPNRTATTPGTWTASAALRRTIRADGTGERTSPARSIPGCTTSPA